MTKCSAYHFFFLKCQRVLRIMNIVRQTARKLNKYPKSLSLYEQSMKPGIIDCVFRLLTTLMIFNKQCNL